MFPVAVVRAGSLAAGAPPRATEADEAPAGAPVTSRTSPWQRAALG